MWHASESIIIITQGRHSYFSNLFLGVFGTTGGAATLATSLTGTLLTGLEATAGGLAALGSDVSL
jgi:hypothetical protein